LSTDPLELLRDVVRRDGRYSLQAYLFVFEALDYTMKKLEGERRHVAGQELLEGIREYARQSFGPLAKVVFRCWGVTCTEDFGEIVFSIVDAGLMGKNDTDCREDFAGGYDFETAFEEED
jgi:uncharacterized repeat protein (TIGR04138 family)